MLSRKEIVDDLVPFDLQKASRDFLDGTIDITAFQSKFTGKPSNPFGAGEGYTHPAAAAYLMEYGFYKIDQGHDEVKSRLEEALSILIKSARSKGLLGMMVEMDISGMRGMQSDSISLKEYASRTGFGPLKDVSIIAGDNPHRIPLGDGSASGKMRSWQVSLAKIMESLMSDLIEGRLSLQEFKRQATNTTGDTTDGYADALFLTMSKGFEYFATHVEQGNPEPPEKLGIFKAAVSAIISAADTDLKKKAVMDDIVKNGIPDEINNAAYNADITLSIEAGYEGTRRPEKLKKMFATATTMPLYDKETNKSVTPVAYAKIVANDSKAILAHIARDVLSILKQHDLSQGNDKPL